ncbi:potassium-transporting ATPase subunit KdpA, partial [Peribacillus simplex]|uniref:potassium-transporting ATPase subunit KdpA n=2 Tax=Bacillales TaxID=1385 RepID=UPI0011A41272
AFDYNHSGLDRFYGPLEKLIYAIGGIRQENQTWKRYAATLVVSNTVMILLVYLVFRTQAYLPLNPAGIANMDPSLA